MKSFALLLLCAAVVQIFAADEYPNGCPTNWAVRKVIPHQRNCYLYYECFMGRLLLRTCPPLMQFSVERGRCVWKSIANCSHSNNPKPEENESDSSSVESDDYPIDAHYICATFNSDGILLAHERCNKYYICDHGKPLAQRCPANLFFNPKTDRCDWRENVHCDDRVIPDPEYDDNSNESPGGGHSNPSEAPHICAKENSTGVLIAHYDCNKYFICDHGKPLAQRCPANLFFNPKTDRCDWRQNVHCYDRVVSDPEYDDNSNESPGGGHSNPSEAPHICAKENSTGVLIAHYDCNKYFICDHGKPVTQRCPTNLFFNPKIDKCDWRQNVACRYY